MLQQESIIKITDNSGAKSALIIHNMGGSKHKFSNIGDIVTCVIKHAIPKGIVKKSQVVKAVIVRTRKGIQRANGEKIKFDENAGVIIDKDKNPIGTRVFGTVTRELKEKGYSKIISLASEVI